MLAPAASTMLRAGVARPCAGGVVSGSSSSTATKATGLSFLRTAATCPYSTMTAPLSLARRVSSPCATTSLLRSQTAAAAAAEAARPSLSMETASAAVAATPRIRPDP
ncbi:hypothetical protein VTK73DRAFT_4217 [Phialemonium thermophilum]|uniref:Uncharacterized protein n=1 Tax=Phialemonium thermophilum TaxID=223376 RepID=A0ABR3VB58_9PEZI